MVKTFIKQQIVDVALVLTAHLQWDQTQLMQTLELVTI